MKWISNLLVLSFQYIQQLPSTCDLHFTNHVLPCNFPGLPKPAIVSHARCLGAASGFLTFSSSSDEVIYEPLPMFHSAALLIGFGNTVTKGACSRSFSADLSWAVPLGKIAFFHRHLYVSIRWMDFGLVNLGSGCVFLSLGFLYEVISVSFLCLFFLLIFINRCIKFCLSDILKIILIANAINLFVGSGSSW